MRSIFRPSFSSASFPLFLFSFGYSVFCHWETTPGYHYTYIRCCIPLHCVTSGQQSCFSRLPAYAFSLFTIRGFSTIAISDSILAKYVTLDCSKACICFVHRSRDIYFTSWLKDIDEFRCSMAEIASITTMFWTLSTILCQVCAGYLYHHPWSETQQTGYSMGVTVSLR